MPGYVIVDVTVRDRDSYERYKQVAAVSVSAYGGRYLVRGGATETLEARAWWASPEYGPARALRQACADTEMVLVEGVPG
jgi:uncharacterized protein (DUF1330 family)